MKNLNITFEDNDFRKLNNMKEAWKITHRCTNWEDFILNVAKIADIDERGLKK